MPWTAPTREIDFKAWKPEKDFKQVWRRLPDPPTEIYEDKETMYQMEAVLALERFALEVGLVEKWVARMKTFIDDSRRNYQAYRTHGTQ